jgi:Xaa-Pro aminopeptidase
MSYSQLEQDSQAGVYLAGMVIAPRTRGAISMLWLGLWWALAAAAPAPAWPQAGAPAGPVPVERLSARRAALMERIGTGVAVFRSARLRSIERDYPQDSDYREDSDVFYLTGLEAPGAWLVLVARPSAPDSAILYLPEREPGSEQWIGAFLGPGPEATRLSGIADVRPASEMEKDLERTVLGPASSARKGALYLKRGSRDSPVIRRLLHAAGGRVTVRDLEDELAPLRQIKDEDEIGRLRRAITITGEAILETMANARPGMYEYELEGRIEYGFRRRGAERVGFPSIVGSGPNGTTLHYDENRRRTRPGELVVMDVGAEHGYYSADITRTIPISGRFTSRQRQLYELVLGAQQAAIDSVRPGTDLPTLNRVARDYMRRNSGQLCGGSGCERYFVHGLCHWLGMDVHDVGVFSRPLEPGMVFTIEPGIYIPAESLGIRIEDDVLVTSRGAEVLSSGVPRTVDEVERAMASDSR